MATYYYDIPVIVKSFDDEDEELLPVKKDVVSRIVDDFNGEHLEQYSSDIVIDSLFAVANGKKIRVKAQSKGRYNSKDEELIRQFISGQCSDGWLENGMELPGQYYGYSHAHIIAYTWDRGFDVVSVKKATEVKE